MPRQPDERADARALARLRDAAVDEDADRYEDDEVDESDDVAGDMDRDEGVTR